MSSKTTRCDSAPRRFNRLPPRLGNSCSCLSAVLSGVPAFAKAANGLPDRTAGARALPQRYCCLGRSSERRVLPQEEQVVWSSRRGSLRLSRRGGRRRHARDCELTLTARPRPKGRHETASGGAATTSATSAEPSRQAGVSVAQPCPYRSGPLSQSASLVAIPVRLGIVVA